MGRLLIVVLVITALSSLPGRAQAVADGAARAPVYGPAAADDSSTPDEDAARSRFAAAWIADILAGAAKPGDERLLPDLLDDLAPEDLLCVLSFLAEAAPHALKRLLEGTPLSTPLDASAPEFFPVLIVRNWGSLRPTREEIALAALIQGSQLREDGGSAGSRSSAAPSAALPGPSNTQRLAAHGKALLVTAVEVGKY